MKQYMKTIYKFAALMIIFAAVAAVPVKAQGLAILPSEDTSTKKVIKDISERAPFEDAQGPLFAPPPGGGDPNHELPVSGGLWILAGFAGAYGVVRKKHHEQKNKK